MVQQPSFLPTGVTLFLGDDGQAYIEGSDRGNSYAVRLASSNGRAIIAALYASEGKPLRPGDQRDVIENAQGWVQQYGQRRHVYSRVAPIDGGIEIDVGDDRHTRIRVIAGRVELVTSGSQILFYRSPNAKSMAPIAHRGDLHLLRSYVNLPEAEYKLFIAPDSQPV